MRRSITASSDGPRYRAASSQPQISCSQKYEIRWTANLQPAATATTRHYTWSPWYFRGYSARDGVNPHVVVHYLDWFDGSEMVNLRGQAKLTLILLLKKSALDKILFRSLFSWTSCYATRLLYLSYPWYFQMSSSKNMSSGMDRNRKF